MTADTVLAGYLLKKSRTLKVWQRKWFVLKRDCALFVFRAPEDVVASRAVPLIGYTLTADADAAEGHDHALVLRHPSSAIVLAAESPADYERSGGVLDMLCADHKPLCFFPCRWIEALGRAVTGSLGGWPESSAALLPVSESDA